MSEIPDNNEGTKIGIIAMERNTPFPAIRLLVKAYAKTKASEIVKTIVTMETNKLLYID